MFDNFESNINKTYKLETYVKSQNFNNVNDEENMNGLSTTIIYNIIFFIRGL